MQAKPPRKDPYRYYTSSPPPPTLEAVLLGWVGLQFSEGPDPQRKAELMPRLRKPGDPDCRVAHRPGPVQSPSGHGRACCVHPGPAGRHHGGYGGDGVRFLRRSNPPIRRSRRRMSAVPAPSCQAPGADCRAPLGSLQTPSSQGMMAAAQGALGPRTPPIHFLRESDASSTSVVPTCRPSPVTTWPSSAPSRSLPGL